MLGVITGELFYQSEKLVNHPFTSSFIVPLASAFFPGKLSLLQQVSRTSELFPVPFKISPKCLQLIRKALLWHIEVVVMAHKGSALAHIGIQLVLVICADDQQTTHIRSRLRQESRERAGLISPNPQEGTTTRCRPYIALKWIVLVRLVLKEEGLVLRLGFFDRLKPFCPSA